MNKSKIITLFLTIVMAVAVTSSVCLADTQNGHTFSTVSGLSIDLPNELKMVLYAGMSEDNPIFQESDPEMGITYDGVMEMYEEGGIELQSSALPVGKDDGQFFYVIVFECDTPEDLNASFAENIQQLVADSFGSTDMFGYGSAEVSGIPVYKIVYQASASTSFRLNQYSIITDSGKMHQINIMLVSDPTSESAEPVPFTEEDLEHLDYLSEYIAGSIKLSDELSEA